MLTIELIILGYLSFVVFHNLFFSLVSNFYSEKKYSRKTEVEQQRILVLIPSYKEDGVIVSSSENAALHNYPKDKFKVVVIADSLKPETIQTLHKTGVEVLEVSFEKSTKVKSLQAALNNYTDYEIAVILDADNMMEPDFLAKINEAYENGYVCIQGRRIAKNTNTQFAFLDGISESINNRIFRRGYNAVGMSASLIGSGMAFPFSILKRHINEMDSVGGFDRELNLRLLDNRMTIAYLESAEVRDEKVEKPEVFANQRKRWLSSQFVYLRKNFFKGCQRLVQGNVAFFESAVLNNILLPRVLALGILFLTATIYLTLSPFQLTEVSPLYPVLLFVLYCFALVIAIPKKYFNKNLLLAILKLPQAFLLMFFTLFKLRNANKTFIHTPHGVTSPSIKDKEQ